MVLSTMSVDPRAGEKWPRGNYCTRGARYGVHSSEENFRNPYYGKLTFLAYFTGGVRVGDVPLVVATGGGGCHVTRPSSAGQRGLACRAASMQP